MRIVISQNKRGFTLTETIVSIVSVSIICLLVLHIVDFQTRMAKDLSQRQEIFNLKQVMMAALSDTQVCTCMLNPAFNKSNNSPLHFPTSGPPPRVQLRQFFLGCEAGSPSMPVATADSPLPGSQTGLKVSSIAFKEIRPTDPASGNQFIGIMEVQFDPASITIPRVPVSLPLRVSVSPGPLAGTAIVSQCVGKTAAQVLMADHSKVLGQDALSKTFVLSRPGYILVNAWIRNAPRATVILKIDGQPLNQSTSDGSGTTYNGKTAEAQKELAPGSHVLEAEVWSTDGLSRVAPDSLDLAYTVYSL